MDVEFLQQNWALVIASILGTAIALFLVFRVAQDSRGGRLAAALRHLRDREQALAAVTRSRDKAGKTLEHLQSKGDAVPPGKVSAARDALQENEETERLLAEQVLVVRNQARTIILEDYPPKKHDALRRKYLGETK